MFKSKNVGRLTLTLDTRTQVEWWPPVYVGQFALWLSIGPWFTACWQRDR